MIPIISISQLEKIEKKYREDGEEELAEKQRRAIEAAKKAFESQQKSQGKQ